MMAKRLVKGYPRNIFQGGEVNPKYLCGLCHFVLRNPVQRFCGHRYCKDCVEGAKLAEANDIVCPTCVAEGGDDVEAGQVLDAQKLYPDNAVRREMIKLAVGCPSCDWQGTFKDFTEHYQQHELAEASSCVFGCGQQLGSEVGLDEHVRSNLLPHLEAIVSRIQILEEKMRHGGDGGDSSSQLITNRIGELEKNVETLHVRMNSLKINDAAQSRSETSAAGAVGGTRDTAESIDNNISILEACITVLNREVERLTTTVDGLLTRNRQEREQGNAVELKVRTLEQQLKIKEAILSDMTNKLTMLELASYDGTFVWAITDVAKKREEAIQGRTTSIYSPPFYTSRSGYKMCLRVYLNGDGMGKGTHLSIFFVVMRGNYDALLRWPFRQKVTLILLSQVGKDNVTDTFRPDPTSSSFKRPANDMNIASGCPLFAPISNIESSAAGYVKEDRMFVKAVVDIADLTIS